MNFVKIVTKSSVLDVTIVLDPVQDKIHAITRSQIDYSNASEKMRIVHNYE